MRQATLVAFYGAKSPLLGGFLQTWQERVGQAVAQAGSGARFRPSSPAQLHATVVGLERAPEPPLRNRNFLLFRGRSRVMRLPRLLRALRGCGLLPFDVRFGGFGPRDRPFESRGGGPYERSFSLQGRIPVLIGWPVSAAADARTPACPDPLERLRRRAQACNVLHRWHRDPGDIDNDLYLRLGVIDGELSNAQVSRIEGEVRGYLSRLRGVIVTLAMTDLALVSYPAADETLRAGDCRAHLIADPRLDDEAFLAALYDQ